MDAVPDALVSGAKSSSVFKNLFNLIWITILIRLTCLNLLHFGYNILFQLILYDPLQVFFRESSIILINVSHEHTFKVVNDRMKVPVDLVDLICMHRIKFGRCFGIKHC